MRGGRELKAEEGRSGAQDSQGRAPHLSSPDFSSESATSSGILMAMFMYSCYVWEGYITAHEAYGTHTMDVLTGVFAEG